MVQVLTLMDDIGSENLALHAEHGLSYWVEAGGRRFLFDCGQGSATIGNAQRLGVNLASADFSACSHSHYDHASGFRDMAEAGCGGRLLYTGPGFWEHKYARDGVKYTDLSAGFDENFLAERRVVHRVCRGVLEIAERCWLVGDFPRVHNFETIPERFVKGEAPDCKRDDFSDEICLAMDTERGLVMLAGCAHPGILNMAEKVHEALGRPIYALFGGTHLAEADDARIDKTIKELCAMGLSVLGLSHCSGKATEERLRACGGVKACHMAVGDLVAIR